MKKTLLFILTILYFFNGCSSDNDESSCPDSLDLEIVSVKNTVCGSSSGEIEVLVPSESYTPAYSINQGVFQDHGLFTNLTAGTYQLTVTLSDDCQFVESITIDDIESFEITTNVKNEDCNNPNSGEIQIETTGTTGIVSFSLNNQAPIQTGEFTNLSAGTYQILVSDETGCELTTIVQIERIVNPQLIYDIIGRNCATNACHGGPQEPNMSKTSEIEELKDRIYARASARTMPPVDSGNSLSDEQIALIECWANQ